MMAVGAVVDLGIKLTLLKMADEASAFSDCDMFPLNDLRMAARALKLFPSFQVFKMYSVVKGDRLKHNFSFEKPFVVAAFLQAAVVVDFCPGFGFDIEFCPITSEHDETFDFFSQL